MCPRTIEANEGPALLKQKTMVLWTEDFSTKGFEYDPSTRKPVKPFMNNQIIAF
jgi:hypothetical protein